MVSVGARTSPFYTTRFNELDAERNGITIETADLSMVFHRMDQVDEGRQVFNFITLEVANHVPSYIPWKLFIFGQKVLDFILPEIKVACFPKFLYHDGRLGLGNRNQHYPRG